MSEHDDELASAYLDDEDTADERAHVESDASLRRRVEELRAARDALSSEPLQPPAAATREAAISAALGASDVVDMESHRARRGLRIASIAAAVLLVLGAAGLLIRAQSDTTTDHFTTAAGPLSTTTTAIGPLAERSAAGAAATAGDAAGPFSTRSSLGTFADRASLAAAAQSGARDNKKASPSAPPTNNSGASSTCVVPQPPDATDEAYAATAILEDRPVQVDVFTIADGSLRLVVTDATSCTQLFSQPV